MKKNGNKGIGKGNILIALILFAIIITRVIYLHTTDLIEHKHYNDPIVSEKLVRGTIYDRNGNILAIQAPDFGFSVKLTESSPSYIASVIEPYIMISAIECANQIQNGISFFQFKDVPDSEMLEELDRILINSYLDKEVSIVIVENRKYPAGSCILDIVGSVDKYMEGVSGIEKTLNNSLRALPVLDKSYVTGSDAVLTIDLDLQFALSSIPELNLEENSSAAILSSKGEILAYSGPITDELLENIVVSISSADEFISFETGFPDERLKTGAIAADDTLSYYIYADADNQSVKHRIINSLENILISQGRIK